MEWQNRHSSTVASGFCRHQVSLVLVLVLTQPRSSTLSSLSQISPQFLRQWKQQPRVGLSRHVPKNLPQVRNISDVFAISFKTETHDWVEGEENNADNVGRLVQLGWTTWDSRGNVLDTKEFCVKPNGFTISAKAARLHGISQQMALKTGQNRTTVLNIFCKVIGEVKANNGFLVTHMPAFDYWVILKELRLYHPGENRLAHVFDQFNKVHTINKLYLQLHSPAEYNTPYWRDRTLGRSLMHSFEIFCEKKVPDEYILARSRKHSAAADAKMVGMVFFALRKRGYLGAVPIANGSIPQQSQPLLSSAKRNSPANHSQSQQPPNGQDTSLASQSKSRSPAKLPLPGVAGAEYMLEFGQYRGFALGDVPGSYLAWLVDNRVYMTHPQLAIALMQLGYLSDPAAKVQGGFLEKLS